MVTILVANGFECAEALVTLDLLHRAGIDADLTALDSGEVVSANGVVVKADRVLSEVGTEAFGKDLEMLILAGGLGNVTTLRESPAVKKVVTQVAAEGRYLAAICAAPLILAELGLVDGRDIVCYPGMEPDMGAANVLVGSKVVTDGKMITGKGPGAVFDFALKLIEALRGEAVMQAVKKEVHYCD